VRPKICVSLSILCLDGLLTSQWPDFRGLGHIGKKLIEAMETWMRAQGYREWKSMVHDFNQHSQNLMIGQGAQTLGHRYRKEF
ncbi:GNAT family N-acetyltransferase, partial [Shimia marina]|uniref:GNAT family N-acetyltransferase n=1 Tax=Shimia marina TaxID=321267 RepID=UPI00071E4084